MKEWRNKREEKRERKNEGKKKDKRERARDFFVLISETLRMEICSH